MDNNSKGIGVTLIDIASLLPREDSVRELFAKYLEYTEKDEKSLDAITDIMALAIGYQMIKSVRVLTEIFKTEKFRYLTVEELCEVLDFSVDLFNQRVVGRGRNNDLL